MPDAADGHADARRRGPVGGDGGDGRDLSGVGGRPRCQGRSRSCCCSSRGLGRSIVIITDTRRSGSRGAGAAATVRVSNGGAGAGGPVDPERVRVHLHAVPPRLRRGVARPAEVDGHGFFVCLCVCLLLGADSRSERYCDNQPINQSANRQTTKPDLDEELPQSSEEVCDDFLRLRLKIGTNTPVCHV